MRFTCAYFSLTFMSGFLLEVVYTIDLPLDKCRLEDSACMVKAFQNAIPLMIKGVPTMGVEVMDVFELDELRFNLTGLAFTLRNGRLKGFKDIIMDSVKWDTKEQKAIINYHVDYCEMWGSYTARGKLLLLPIQGNGEINLQFRNLYIKLTLYYDISQKGGKSFAHVKRYMSDYDVRGNIRYNLTNLFNGNKDLGDTLLNLMNDNWKQVCEEFGKPLMDGVSKRTFKNVNKFLSHAPIEEITIM